MKAAVIVYVATLAVAVAAAGLQTVRLADEQREHAETRRQHATRMAELEAQARTAEADARAEEQRRAAALQEVIRETESELARARADAAAAADAGERLRAHIAAATACGGRAGGDPGTAGSGAPARATADLLADVQRRIDAATDGIAGFADRAHTAGRACERGYDALKAR